MPDLCEPPYLPVTVSVEEEFRADHAELYVTVRGTSFLSGDIVFKKSLEVAQLVAALRAVGLAEEHIQLQGVRAESGNNSFTKSCALYDLRIHCPTLTQFADLVTVILSQKSYQLREVRWRYPDLQRKQEQWLRQCLQQAKHKAAIIAEELGVRLAGIYRFEECLIDPERPYHSPFHNDLLGRSNRGIMAEMGPYREELQLNPVHSKTVTYYVQVKYLISESASFPNKDQTVV